jgi:hypothetical protein
MSTGANRFQEGNNKSGNREIASIQRAEMRMPVNHVGKTT